MTQRLKGVLGVALVVVLLASLTVGLMAVPAGAATTSNLKFTKLSLPKVEDWNIPSAASTTVSGAVTASATTITVTSTAAFPASGVLLINGSEMVSYAGKTTGPDTFTGCNRGVFDTTAAAYSGGESVVLRTTPTSEATFADAEGDFWAAPGTDVGPIAMSPDGGVLFASVNPDGGLWWDVLKSTDGGYTWTVTGLFAAAYAAADPAPSIVDIVTSPEYSDDTTVVVASVAYVYISDDGGKNFVVLDRPGTMTGNITDLDVTIADDGDLAIMVCTSTGQLWVKKGLLGWQDQLLAGTTALACAFLPTFADDGNIGICAIYTTGTPGPNNGTTVMSLTFNDINDGGGWGTSGIVNAPFTNADGDPFGSVYARIAFADDFDAFGVGNNVVFAGITTAWGADTLLSTDGDDAYKVTLKEAGTSSAVDLDVRGVLTTLLPTATAITSIDVCGDAESATILVGTDCCNLGDTPTYWFVYKSDDAGDSWQFSFKQPTGGDEQTTNVDYTDAMTRVLMGPDFCTSGNAYCSTMDLGGPIGTSAFQMTNDGATSWNQISIIDDFFDYPSKYWVTSFGFSAAGYIANDTLRMITSQESQAMGPADVTYGSLYERMGTKHWVRIFSYATPGVTDSLNMIADAKDGSASFIVDMANSCMWRTTDNGATFPKKINTKGGLEWVTPLSATTLYTGNDAAQANNSGIWWTTKSGTGWTKPTNSDMSSTAVVSSLDVMGTGDTAVVIAATYDGQAFISSDAGVTVKKVGKNDPGVAGPPSLVTADLGFATNGILYFVTIAATGHGVWRTSVDLSDPGACTWSQIDNNQDSTGTPIEYNNSYVTCSSPAIALPPSDILYVSDMYSVGADPDYPTLQTGGLWRSANPTADTDSVAPPYFERTTKGLSDGASLGLLSLDLNPPSLSPTFFFENYGYTNYWEQVVYFTDTLNVGATLASPDNSATGVGLLPEGYVYPEVNLAWQEMPGATSYEYQVAIDPGFLTKVADAYTNSLATPPLQLNPNQTYYWRVRVAAEGTLLGAPLISPWSATWKFTTAIGASSARPKLQAPWAGEDDVPLSPTFQWSGIAWAQTYVFELATDPTTTTAGFFTSPLVSLAGSNALTSTAWKCNTNLDYNTRYYWHVKAVGVNTETPWSDVGTFTTMGTPAPTPSAQPPVVIPPAQQITPAWIWAIVIIGAILVIAVIVLIVTTRRVP